MKFKAWYLLLESVLCTASAIFADEVKVVLLSRSLRNAMACTVLPDIALLARNTMAAIVLIADLV